MRSVANLNKGYWKHYGHFTLFTAIGSLASAVAWAFNLKSLSFQIDAVQKATSDSEVISSYASRSQQYTFGVVFQVFCKRLPPPPHCHP
jgi:hypothetical protein